MNVFEPLRTYSSPLRTAVVLIRATSEPASGSVSPNEQRIGSSISGGSQVALLLLGAGGDQRAGAEAVAAERGPDARAAPVQLLGDERSPRAGRARARRTRPGCAGSSGRPRAPSRSRRPGWVMCTSYSAAFGRISFSAKSCASSRSARCSSVRVKATPSVTGCSAIDMLGRFLPRLTSQSMIRALAPGGKEALNQPMAPPAAPAPQQRRLAGDINSERGLRADRRAAADPGHRPRLRGRARPAGRRPERHRPQARHGSDRGHGRARDPRDRHPGGVRRRRPRLRLRGALV